MNVFSLVSLLHILYSFFYLYLSFLPKDIPSACLLLGEPLCSHKKKKKTIKDFNKAYRKTCWVKSMLDKFKIPITTDIATLTILISIMLLWKQNIFLRLGKDKTKPFHSFTWGERFVVVTSWNFCHNKIGWNIPLDIYFCQKFGMEINTKGLHCSRLLLRWIENMIPFVFAPVFFLG